MSSDNQSSGIYSVDISPSGLNTITGEGNIIRDADSGLVFDNGRFSIAGINVTNSREYDIQASNSIIPSPSITSNVSVYLVNSTINISKINISEFSNFLFKIMSEDMSRLRIWHFLVPL
jgi:hypothetical protein